MTEQWFLQEQEAPHKNVQHSYFSSIGQFQKMSLPFHGDFHVFTPPPPLSLKRSKLHYPQHPWNSIIINPPPLWNSTFCVKRF